MVDQQSNNTNNTLSLSIGTIHSVAKDVEHTVTLRVSDNDTEAANHSIWDDCDIEDNVNVGITDGYSDTLVSVMKITRPM